MSIKFDLHMHTIYSDGASGHIDMAEIAEARGMEAIAFTDHGPELVIGIARGKIPQMLQDIEIARQDANIQVLAGLEANVVDGWGGIDIEDEVINKLDFVMMAIHDLGTTDRIEIAQEYLARATKAIEIHKVDVFSHPFYFFGDLMPELSHEDVREFVKLAAARNVAMEINVKYKVPGKDFLKLCFKEGVKLSIGSDAHKPAEVGKIDWALSALRYVGAKREDLILDSVLK